MRRIAACIALVTCPLTASLAGPLNPPAGAVSASMKTLSEVEPRTAINAANTPGDADSVYRITQPGSYYLTGNLTGASGKSTIEVQATGVTIDLGGFSITGVPGSIDGIAAGGQWNTTIRNGTVRAHGRHGVFVGGGSQTKAHDLTVNDNTSTGLMGGYAAQVTRVTAKGNGDRGIWMGSMGVIESCVATDNTHGIDIGSNGIARGCNASDNDQHGFYNWEPGGHFVNCTAYSNSGDGFHGNTEAVIEKCVASWNTGNGIRVDTGSSVTGCTSQHNGFNGTGAGVLAVVTASRVRIEGNTCSSNDTGVKVEGSPNVVLGNRCSNNTVAFSIAAFNRVGAIVLMGTNAAPINGSSGGSAVGAVDDTTNIVF